MDEQTKQTALDALLDRRDKEDDLTPLEEAILRDWGEWYDYEKSVPAAAELSALRADNARLAAERDALRDIVNRAYAAHQSDALCKCLQCKILRLSPSIVDLDAAALTADAGGDG
jgi:predicted signal transduction protein with EAL and GGDEF domain